MTRHRSDNAIKLTHHREQLAAAVKTFVRQSRTMLGDEVDGCTCEFCHTLLCVCQRGEEMLMDLDRAIALEDEATV